MDTIRFESEGPVAVITIDRPERRNAVDRPTARQLAEAFRRFDADGQLSVAVLNGAGGCFCAGADLRAFGSKQANRLETEGSPMGPSHMVLSKPVIAAVEGHAVAGGLELAIWCDLRIAARDAVFGVFCRRWGVPLVDGGTVRLSRMLGHSHALDLILTGRGVCGDEALRMGLANRLVEPGTALEESVSLARELAAFPQRCLRSDRLSSYRQWDLPIEDALALERRFGRETIDSGESRAGAERFKAGAGRHGQFDD